MFIDDMMTTKREREVLEKQRNKQQLHQITPCKHPYDTTILILIMIGGHSDHKVIVFCE